MSKIISIISGKGGVGKTTTAINLGAALNSFEKDVIILDANLTTPSVGLHLGAPLVPISLNQALSGKANIIEAIYEHESGLKIIPSSLSVKELKNINNSRLKDVGKNLKRIADFIIYDSAAGLGEEATSAIDSADEVIIVTNPEILAVTSALKASKLVESMGKRIRGVIVTRTNVSSCDMPLDNIKEMLELPILGFVPEDKRVKEALVLKDALVHTHPNSKAAKAYKKIAAKIAGIDYKEKNFFGKVLDWI